MVLRTMRSIRPLKFLPSPTTSTSMPVVPSGFRVKLCKTNGLVMLAFAPPGHGMKPGVLEDPVIRAVVHRVNQTPAQVRLA